MTVTDAPAESLDSLRDLVVKQNVKLTDIIYDQLASTQATLEDHGERLDRLETEVGEINRKLDMVLERLS